MVAADVEAAIHVFITPHFWAGGSHNKTCWVKYLCEINSCDKAVMRDRREGDKEMRGEGRIQENEKRCTARETKEKGQTLRGKPTWPHASGMSAASRLVAIRYPSLLKYYTHWLMLTVWPEGGDCVGKCVCLHLDPAASKSHFPLPKSCKQHDCGFSWGFLRQMFTRSTLKINKEELNCWRCFPALQRRWLFFVEINLQAHRAA